MARATKIYTDKEVNLYKEALVAYLAGLTIKSGDWIKWQTKYNKSMWIKGAPENGIVIKYANSNEYWYNESGKPHRNNGPAVVRSDGENVWYLNGERHRIDGPAIEYSNGDTAWYLNGKLHRIDGPAIERTNNYKEWWVNNEYISEEEFNKLRK